MQTAAKARPRSKEIWEQFCNDKGLLAAHQVTGEELKFLASVQLFGSLKSVDDILLILRNIR